jgi:hypothetical protein
LKKVLKDFRTFIYYEKNNIIINLLIATITSFSQIDTSKLYRDSIYTQKAIYIGQPLSNIINKIPYKRVSFFRADKEATRMKGQAYYDNITMLIFQKSGFVSSGLRIKLEQKVYVDLAEKRKIGFTNWDIKLRIILGSAKVLSIEKF